MRIFRSKYYVHMNVSWLHPNRQQQMRQCDIYHKILPKTTAHSRSFRHNSCIQSACRLQLLLLHGAFNGNVSYFVKAGPCLSSAGFIFTISPSFFAELLGKEAVAIRVASAFPLSCQGMDKNSFHFLQQLVALGKYNRGRNMSVCVCEKKRHKFTTKAKGGTRCYDKEFLFCLYHRIESYVPGLSWLCWGCDKGGKWCKCSTWAIMLCTTGTLFSREAYLQVLKQLQLCWRFFSKEP